MTEADWRDCDDPARMLAWLHHPPAEYDPAWERQPFPSERQVRLFLEECCYTSREDEKAALLREIIGNPFRPVCVTYGAGYVYHGVTGGSSFPKECLTPTVLSIANRIYEERDFAGMPILADALEDAGCDNEEFLRHCRGEELIPSPHMPKIGLWGKLRGTHVRGCWVLDMILGKE